MPAAKRTPERKSRSGSYVHEAQRGTVRVRISREAHEAAAECGEPARVIEHLLLDDGTVRDHVRSLYSARAQLPEWARLSVQVLHERIENDPLRPSPVALNEGEGT